MNDEYRKLNSQLFSITQALTKSIVPVFDISNDFNKEVIGSAIFLKYKQEYFLLTCVHVIGNEAEYNLHLYLNKEFYSFKDDVFLISSEDVENDQTDLAVHRLKDTTTESLLNEGFQCWEIKEGTYKGLTGKRLYHIVIGYPATRNKFRTVVNPKAIAFGAFEVSDEVYDKLNRSKQNDFFLDVNYKDAMWYPNDDETPVTLPKLNGISGGGVWLVGDFSPAGTGLIPPKLVGTTRFIDKKEKALKVTRIQHFYYAYDDYIKNHI